MAGTLGIDSAKPVGERCVPLTGRVAKPLVIVRVVAGEQIRSTTHTNNYKDEKNQQGENERSFQRALLAAYAIAIAVEVKDVRTDDVYRTANIVWAVTGAARAIIVAHARPYAAAGSRVCAATIGRMTICSLLLRYGSNFRKRSALSVEQPRFTSIPSAVSHILIHPNVVAGSA